MPRDVLEARWSRSALRSSVRSGKVTRLLPGFYAASEHTESLFTRAHGATTWVGPDSVLVGSSAASVWSLCASSQDRIVVSAAYGTHRICPPWVRLRRMAAPLPPAEWRQCLVATPAWAAITAYAETSSATRDGLIYRAVQRGLATPTELATVADEVSRVPDRRHLMRVIAATADGAESHLETLGLRTVFATREFSGFIRQHRLRVQETAYRLDMYDPITRTAVELDGTETHGVATQRARDIRRDAKLASAGIVTLRFTYGDIADRAQWCRTMVRKTLAARSAVAQWA